jgi:hypothetical protein
MIILFWVISVLFGFSDFYIPSNMYSFCHQVDTSNFCVHAYCTAYDSEYLQFGMSLVVFAIMFGIYCRIYSLLRKYQLFKGRHRKNMKKNRKGLITTFFILGTFMLCLLPYCIFEVVINVLMVTDVRKVIHYFNLVSKFDYYLFDLLLVNSLCDPIIYAVRMREFRLSYRNLVYRWCKKTEAGTVCRDRFSEAEFASREISCRYSNGTCTVSIMPPPSTTYTCDAVNPM